MAKENVQIVFSADSAQARALFDQMANGLRRVEAESKKTNDQMNTISRSVSDFATRTFTLGGIAATAFGLARTALSRFNEELVKAATASREIEENVGRLATQSGSAISDDPKMQAALGSLAKRNAVTMKQAGDAATQLISSGFSPDAVLSGGAGDAFLQSLHAMNASGRGQDPRELAMGMARFLKGSGQGLSGESMSGLSVPLFNLFMGTDMQAQDLSHFGSKAAILSQLGGMTPNEMLAAFSVARDVKGPSEASTALGAIVSRLAASGGTKETVDALKAMGLSPSDVDFKGEGFTGILGTLQAGSQRVPEGARAGVLKKLIGQEHLDTLLTLMSGRDEIVRRQGMLGETGAYSEAVRRRLTSIGAGEARSQVDVDLANQELGNRQRQYETARRVIDAGMAAKGEPAWIRTMHGMAGDFVDNIPFVGSAVRNSMIKDEAQRPNAIQVEIKLPNQTRVPGTAKATEHLQGLNP